MSLRRPVVAQVILVHANPLKVKWAKVAKLLSIRAKCLLRSTQGVRKGQSEFYPEIPDFLLVVAARDAEHLQILRSGQLSAYR